MRGMRIRSGATVLTDIIVELVTGTAALLLFWMLLNPPERRRIR